MRTLLCLLLLSLLLAPDANAADIVVRDDAGRQVVLERAARRIVSLAPHATELLFAAGAGNRVVGVVGNSDYPAGARERPVVGNAASLNLEAIIALRPDLVVAWKSGNNGAALERLAGLGVAVFYSEPRRLEDVASNLQRLGTLAGTAATAQSAARQFLEDYRQLAREYAGRATVRTFYQIWAQPLITVNGQHLISQVIGLCGGRNIFTGLDALAPVVNREAVLVADPQIIIAGGKPGERARQLDSWQAWTQVSAVKNRQLYLIDPDLIQRQGPRILEGARIMCRQIEKARSAAREDADTHR